MNHSIHSADRSTHLKIVVVALVAGIAVAALGISARTGVGLDPDRSRREGRQGDHGDQLQRRGSPLGQAQEFLRDRMNRGRLRAAFLLLLMLGEGGLGNEASPSH